MQLLKLQVNIIKNHLSKLMIQTKNAVLGKSTKNKEVKFKNSMLIKCNELLNRELEYHLNCKAVQMIFNFLFKFYFTVYY